MSFANKKTQFFPTLNYCPTEWIQYFKVLGRNLPDFSGQG